MQMQLPLYNSVEEQRIAENLDVVSQNLQEVQAEFDRLKAQGNTEELLALAHLILGYADLQVEASFLVMDVERKRLKILDNG